MRLEDASDPTSIALRRRLESERELLQALGSWSSVGRGPLYQKLADALRRAFDREIPVGTLLPPERRLAELLIVSRTTVVTAYKILRSEGWLESRRGSGTRVAQSQRPHPVEESLALGGVSRFRNTVDRGLSQYDFSGDSIGAATLMTGEFCEELASKLAAVATEGGYRPHGLPSLRGAIARHLSARGLPTDQRQVLVTAGAQQAINLLAQLLIPRGAVAVVEDPTYAGALDALTAVGARIVSMPVEDQVASWEALDQVYARHRPRLVYLTPTFQNPTGVVLSSGRRRQLAEFAGQYGVTVVEDTTLESLALSRTPPAPIAAHDRSGHVVTIGSLSKTAWSGIRIGWIRAEPVLIDRLVRLKTVADLATSLPSQIVAELTIEHFDRIVGERIELARDRLALATHLLHSQLPRWEFTVPQGGQSLWIRLPQGDGEGFGQAALREGVVVIPGPLVSPTRSFSDHVRLVYLQESYVLREGVARLATAWERYTSADRDLAVVV
jgi:DNA-binding transcriptional MocR family regulator